MNATSIPAADDLAQRYGAAWKAHELDEIMSMQTPGMQFELKLGVTRRHTARPKWPSSSASYS